MLQAWDFHAGENFIANMLEQATAYCEQTGTTLTAYADLLEQGYGAELWREPCHTSP